MQLDGFFVVINIFLLINVLWYVINYYFSRSN